MVTYVGFATCEVVSLLFPIVVAISESKNVPVPLHQVGNRWETSGKPLGNIWETCMTTVADDMGFLY